MDVHGLLDRNRAKQHDLISAAIGVPSEIIPSSASEQESLKDLHDAATELAAFPKTLSARDLEGGSGRAAVSAPTLAEVEPLSVPAERAAVLAQALRLRSLDAQPLAADALKERLARAADRPALELAQRQAMAAAFAERRPALLQKRARCVERWARHCSDARSQELLRPAFDERMRSIEREIDEATRRAARLAAAPTFTVDDISTYYRWAAQSHALGKRMSRLLATVRWMPYRGASELVLRARRQMLTAAAEATEAAPGKVDATGRRRLLLIEVDPNLLNAELVRLLDSFEVEVEGVEVKSASEGGEGTAGLLNREFEAELSHAVKAVFGTEFKRQSSYFRFAPYGAAVLLQSTAQEKNTAAADEGIVVDAGNELSAEGRKELFGADEDEDKGDFDNAELDLESVHSKPCDWAPLPGLADGSSGLGNARGASAEGVLGGMDVSALQAQTVTLRAIAVESLDDQFCARLGYIEEHSLENAKKHVEEAAKRQQTKAFQVAIGGILEAEYEEHRENSRKNGDERGIKPDKLPELHLRVYQSLKLLKTRDSKHKVLMSLNFCRAVERLISKREATLDAAERNGDATVSALQELDLSAQSGFDSFFYSQDDTPIVQDSAGVNVVYDVALADLKALDDMFKRLGTHVMNVNRCSFSGQDGTFFPDIEAFAADLYESEATYQDAKRQVIERYVEMLDHAVSGAEVRRLINTLRVLLAARPKLEMEAGHFSAAYTAEVVSLRLHSELLAKISSDQVDLEKAKRSSLRSTASAAANWDGIGDKPLRVGWIPEAPFEDLSVRLFGDDSLATGALDFCSLLPSLVELSTALHGASARILRNFEHDVDTDGDGTWDPCLVAALQQVVISEAMVEWQLLLEQDEVAAIGLHRRPDMTKPKDDSKEEAALPTAIPDGASRHAEDPFLIENPVAVELMLGELCNAAEPDPQNANAAAQERDLIGLWSSALSALLQRNELMRECFECAVLSAAYGSQVAAFGNTSGSVSTDELRAARGDISALSVDYLPKFALAELDVGMGTFNFHTPAGLQAMIDGDARRELDAAVQTQIMQTEMLACVIDYNHPRVVSITMEAIRGGGGGGGGGDKTKISQSGFLSLHKIKEHLVKQVSAELKQNSKKQLTDEQLRDFTFGLIAKYLSSMYERVRGYSLVSQCALLVRDITLLTRKWQSGGGDVFHVSSRSSFGTKDDDAMLEDDPRGPSDHEVANMDHFFPSNIKDGQAAGSHAYDPWVLPEVENILHVNAKSSSVQHDADGMVLRYRTLHSLRTLLRTIKLDQQLRGKTADAELFPEQLAQRVAQEMLRIKGLFSFVQPTASSVDRAQLLENVCRQRHAAFVALLCEMSAEAAKTHRVLAAPVLESTLAANGRLLAPQPRRQAEPLEAMLMLPDALDDMSVELDSLTQDDRAALVRQGDQLVLAHKRKLALVENAPQLQSPRVAAAVETELEYWWAFMSWESLKRCFFRAASAVGQGSFDSFEEQSTLYEREVMPLVREATKRTKPPPHGMLIAHINGLVQVTDGMLQRAAHEHLEEQYATLSGKVAGEVSAAQARASEGEYEKRDLLMAALDEIKGSSEFVVDSNGEPALQIREAQLEAKMASLAAELRRWGAEREEAVRAVTVTGLEHAERLLHTEERRAAFLDFKLEMEKRSFHRRVEAGIIDKSYKDLLEIDHLRRQNTVLKQKLTMQEPDIRAACIEEHRELVQQLVEKLTETQSKFKLLQGSVREESMAAAAEAKMEGLKAFAGIKHAPKEFKAQAREALEDLTAEDLARKQSADAMRAVTKLKGFATLKEIRMKSKYEKEIAELKRLLDPDGDGIDDKEELEERVMLMEDQISEARTALSQAEIDLKAKNTELHLAKRAKAALMTTKLSLLKKNKDLEFEMKGAELKDHERALRKSQAAGDKQATELTRLKGAESRAESRASLMASDQRKQIGRMESEIRRERSLKLQAYSRLEQATSDLGASGTLNASLSLVQPSLLAEKYESVRNSLRGALRENDILISTLMENNIPPPDSLMEASASADPIEMLSQHRSTSRVPLDFERSMVEEALPTRSTAKNSGYGGGMAAGSESLPDLMASSSTIGMNDSGASRRSQSSLAGEKRYTTSKSGFRFGVKGQPKQGSDRPKSRTYVNSEALTK